MLFSLFVSETINLNKGEMIMRRFLSLLCLCVLLCGQLSYSATADTGETTSTRNIYQPETGLILPPSVIQIMDSTKKLSSLTGKTPPQAAWFTVGSDTNLTVYFKDGNAPLNDVLAICKGQVIPVLEIADKAGANQLTQYLSLHGETDLIIASRSSDALKVLNNAQLPFVTLAWITENRDASEISRNAHCYGALIVVLDDATRETVEYLQKHFLTVTLRRLDDSADKDRVGAAVDCGANGVVVGEASTAYSLYSMVKTKTYIRRAFVIAHRGMPLIAPENSLEGLKEAYKAGADAVECDVFLTADGHLVINHDGTLKGYTTDSKADAAVTDLTREQLKQYTLKPVGAYTACKFAFLDEFFSELKKNPTKMLVVELKSQQAGLADAVSNLAETYKVTDQIVLISNYIAQLQRARQAMPEVGSSLLFPSGSGTPAMAAEAILSTVCPYPFAASPSSLFNTGAIPLLNARGISVNMWTYNQLTVMSNIAAKGPTFITTDTADCSTEFQKIFGSLKAKDILGFEPAKVNAAKTTLTVSYATTTAGRTTGTAKTSGVTANTTRSTVPSSSPTTISEATLPTDTPVTSETTALSPTDYPSESSPESVTTLSSNNSEAKSSPADAATGGRQWLWAVLAVLLIALLGAGIWIWLWIRRRKTP